jgi:hypothetical protein
MSEVRRFFCFLQYGTSARLAAPLNCMPAPEYAGRSKPGGKKSSPRPLPLDWNPDGMEQKPFEPRQLEIAEGHRVRRRSIRSLRALRSHGVFTQSVKPANKNDSAFPQMRALFEARR